jgi:membrane protein
VANDTLSKLKRLHAQCHDFFTERHIGREDDARRSRLHRFAHFWLLVGKSFVRNRCPVRASALAYTTLLALIPLLAVGVSITTGLLQKEGERPVREIIDRLISNIAPALNLEVKGEDATAVSRREEVIKKITDFIAQIQSGALGLTSTVALVFVAIGLFRTIEATLNDIWGVTSGRGWLASIVQYWALISLGPVTLVLALGLTTGAHFGKTAVFLERMPWVSGFLFQLLPFAVLSCAFALLYQFMPNTRVKWKAAAVGGVVGGGLWQINNKLSVLYVSKAVTYNGIYGSLSIIPLMLIGIYFSWLILLFGAQVAYAFQNRQTYLQDKQAETVNQRGREFIAVRLMTYVAQRFLSGHAPEGVNEFSAVLGVPTRLLGHILRPLQEARLLVEVIGNETAYTPARPLDQITVHDIMQALRAGQGLELETKEDPSRSLVRNRFDRVSDAEREVARVLTLEMLAREASALTLAAPTPIVRSA